MFRAHESGLWLLSGPLESESCARLYETIYHADPSEPVLLSIDSPGGDALFSLALVQALKPFKHLETRGLGEVCSAAVWLLQAGKHRTCYPSTSFLIHNLYSDGVRLDATSATGYAQSMARSASNAADMLARRTKKPARFWSDFMKTDQWIGAADALKLGLVDEIL